MKKIIYNFALYSQDNPETLKTEHLRFVTGEIDYDCWASMELEDVVKKLLRELNKANETSPSKL